MSGIFLDFYVNQFINQFPINKKFFKIIKRVLELYSNHNYFGIQFLNVNHKKLIFITIRILKSFYFYCFQDDN